LKKNLHAYLCLGEKGIPSDRKRIGSRSSGGKKESKVRNKDGVVGAIEKKRERKRDISPPPKKNELPILAGVEEREVAKHLSLSLAADGEEGSQPRGEICLPCLS